MKTGDLIKMTALRSAPNFGGIGYASPKSPAYFIVTSAHLNLLARALWFADPKERTYATILGNQWMIANNAVDAAAWGDSEPEIASPDEIPDAVWAEVAKRVLLGDLNFNDE